MAYGGLLHLTGEPDRPPVRPGVTISDYLTGVFAAMAAVAGLYRRDRQGHGHAGERGGGTIIDAPLYGAVLRVLEWTLAGYDQLGVVRSREGNRLRHSAPLDNYPTTDGAYVCIVAGSTPTSQGCAGPWTDPTCWPTPASPPWPAGPPTGRR